ncbi:capsular polysaccharide export protein, LipB/KpsS family [Acuticoccus mangrovi]|uniref:Uncharacterized protein n=1 Tax=Acuticoccus mangrovi TaxID=2796142 RepID=A0A934MJY8_9HYPH|nr:hypothetical protein [Acuticoccus mangrovi]MBJ3775004.1 hypothetical protein [Acuticoccus mangrovi]
MPLKRIVFTGDLLRPSWDSTRPTQHYNIQWGHDLIGRQMAAATGLPVEMAVWNFAGVTAGGIDYETVRGIYGAHGLATSIEAWAMLYEEALAPAAEAFFREIFRDALVVAFELPPYLEKILQKYGIPYVDVIVHPVRFLDDIFLAVRTSSGAANAVLASHAISEELIETVAGVQSASARRGFTFAPIPNSALLLLQTRFDRTQIRDGGFIGASNFLEKIADVTADYNALYVKEHPLERGSVHTRTLQAAFPKIQLIDHNVYSLLSTENITGVFTLSSSVGIEAPYFGKKSKYIYKAPNLFARDGKVPEGEEFAGVFDAFLGPDFWRDVLAPMTDVTAKTGVTVPFKPNRLRTSLRSFWAFNEIDTDAAVMAAKPRAA